MAFWVVRCRWQSGVTAVTDAPGTGGEIFSFSRGPYETFSRADLIAQRKRHFQYPGHPDVWSALVFDDADFGLPVGPDVVPADLTGQIGQRVPDRWMRTGAGTEADPYGYVPVWSTAAALRLAQAGIAAAADQHPGATVATRHGLRLQTDLGVSAETTLVLRAVAEAAGIGTDANPALVADPGAPGTLHRLSTPPWRCAAAMAALERHATRHSALAFFLHQAHQHSATLASADASAAQRAAAYTTLVQRFDSLSTAQAAAAWTPPVEQVSKLQAEREAALAQEWMAGREALAAAVGHAKENACRQLQQPSRRLTDVPVTHAGYGALVVRLGEIDALLSHHTGLMFTAHLAASTTPAQMRALVDAAKTAIAAQGTKRILLPPPPTTPAPEGGGAPSEGGGAGGE